MVDQVAVRSEADHKQKTCGCRSSPDPVKVLYVGYKKYGAVVLVWMNIKHLQLYHILQYHIDQ